MEARATWPQADRGYARAPETRPIHRRIRQEQTGPDDLNGNLYSSETMQLSTYLPSHVEVPSAAAGGAPGSSPTEPLVTAEMHTPPEILLEFLTPSRPILHETVAEDIDASIRAIRKGETTFLPWVQRLNRRCNPDLRYRNEWRRHCAPMFA